MSIIRTLGHRLQTVLGSSIDQIARQTGVVQRQRKFSGVTLLKTLVFTLLKSPSADTDEYVFTASKFGVIVTPEAIQKRFSPRLVSFLREALKQFVAEVVAHAPVDVELLRKFTSVRIGDSTTITLPDELATEYPGCGGTANYGKAALKIQVLWDLLTDQLLTLDLEPGRRSDAKSALLEGPVPARSLSIFDLGYFCVERFAELVTMDAFWISRWQQGTATFHPDGQPLDLLKYVSQHQTNGPIDMPILLGAARRLPCRLLALRVPQEIADRRRQKALEKARKHGRTASREQLAWCDWTVFVTNCEADLLTWKEIVVLYRARWQIENSHSQCPSRRSLSRAA